MTSLETGTFLGHIPFARVGAQPDPVLVVAGGQAFVQRPTPARVARDARRLARIMPPGRSFILVGYDPTPPDYRLGTIGRDLRAAAIGHTGRMRALLCLCIAACAGTPVRVRDIEGRPLPTSARLDADVAPIQITCGATHYLIVARPRPYLAGTHLGTVRPHVRDAREFCRTVER